jgi:uncharacterized protein (DUF885 family)
MYPTLFSRPFFRCGLAFSLCLLSLNSAPLFSSAQASPTQVVMSTTDSFSALVDSYFDEYFNQNPSHGTYLGLHQYDHQIEDYSLKGIEADITQAKSYLERFEKIGTTGLSASEAEDRELLLNHLHGRLLEAEKIRSWEKNPDIYSSGASESVYTLISRNFAPAKERLKAVIAREKQIPAIFQAAQANLNNPPRIFTEVAIEQVPDIIDFFENTVPAAFAEVKDPVLLAQFKTSNQAVIQALHAYLIWLKQDLLPKSKGDFRIGADNYRQKLLYDEMVDLPLPRLLEIGMADLRKNQAHFKAVAAQLDPSRSAEQILADLGKDHPAPDKLLQSFRDVLGGLKGFIESHKIITIPSPVLPRIEETPSFMRALTFASMDTPGPFEYNAKEAYFNVTLPDPTWKTSEIEEYMAGFNHAVIISTAIHEAYPGHYIQFLWAKQAPSKVRQILDASTNSEGWAHYCEQMMLDEGYGNGDLKLRLGQLQDALLRNARYIVGIQMHTGKMSFEEGVDFFVKEGYQSRTNALLETRRGTSDPTYLYYTLGKLQIQKLRQDYQALKGKDFSLQAFHDRFIQQGLSPIKLIRKQMLGNDSPVL